MGHHATRAALLATLRLLLQDLFRVRSEAVAHAKIARAHGYTDGFMQALISAGVATRAELQVIVDEERARASTPPPQPATIAATLPARYDGATRGAA